MIRRRREKRLTDVTELNQLYAAKPAERQALIGSLSESTAKGLLLHILKGCE